MNQEFQKYNSVSAQAFADLNKKQDVIDRKAINFLNLLPSGVKTVLCTGLSPVAVGIAQKGYSVSLIDAPALDTEYSSLFSAFDSSKRYDAVIANDEYFTFATSEETQQSLINTVCDLTAKILITTVCDYKNMKDNGREFSDPQGYKTIQGSMTYLEKHIKIGRNSWQTKIYQIDDNDVFSTSAAIMRRSLYFKQLARQAEDNHAINFEFQKNMMYKGMLKKNYEHIIAIKF